MTRLRAPVPYFGSKYDIAEQVWLRLGNPSNYVEPFAGSLAVLLARPEPGKVETVNDYSGLVTNFWRAVQREPVEVARYADNPVHELDLHAWHRLLVECADGLRDSLGTDPRFYDVELAGRWAWGASAWLGSGWCDGTLPKRKPKMDGGSGRARNGHGVHRTDLSLHQTRPHLSTAGMGVHATQLPHLSGGGETGVGYGRGVHSRAGRQFDGLAAWMLALADRLRFVRVCCGDFERVLTRAVTTSHGLTAVFLDPPYDPRRRATRIYANEDAKGTAHEDTVAQRAGRWARENGDNPMFRIALAGLAGEHDMPPEWFELSWQTGGGYGNQAADGRGKVNAKAERIWFSPHCIREQQGTQFLLFRA